MNIHKINTHKALNQIQDFWTPYIAGELNQQYIKLAKFKGDFIWHSHEKEDEFFFIF